MERKWFGFCAAALFSKKLRFNLHHTSELSTSLFSVLVSGEARPVTALGGNSSVRSHFANTSHRLLTSVRVASSVLLRIRFVASFESSADRNELSSFLCYVAPVAIKVLKFIVESYFVLLSLHNRSGGFAIIISRHEVGKAISQWLVVLREPAFL